LGPWSEASLQGPFRFGAGAPAGGPRPDLARRNPFRRARGRGRAYPRRARPHVRGERLANRGPTSWGLGGKPRCLRPALLSGVGRTTCGPGPQGPVSRPAPGAPSVEGTDCAAGYASVRRTGRPTPPGRPVSLSGLCHRRVSDALATPVAPFGRQKCSSLLTSETTTRPCTALVGTGPKCRLSYDLASASPTTNT